MISSTTNAEDILIVIFTAAEITIPKIEDTHFASPFY
jgi:hypothetical protein